MSDFQVPVPTQEKVGRVVTWGLLAAAVIIGGNYLLPHANTFLGLIETALSSTVNIAISAAGLLVGSYAAISFAPVVKQGIDVFARRATWKLVHMSPTIHLELALEEVQRDVASFEQLLGNIEEVKASTEQRRNDAMEKANKAQGHYNTSMNKLQSASLSEVERIEVSAAATSFSREAGTWAEAAKKFNASVERLNVQEVQNTRLYHVFKSEAKSMEVDIQIQASNWQQAIAEGQIIDMSERLLLKKSQKQRFAEMATKVITDRYSSNIGRMRNVKRLAQDAFNTFDLETGAYNAVAFEKWQQQMTQVIDNSSGKIEQVPIARIAAAQPVPRF